MDDSKNDNINPIPEPPRFNLEDLPAPPRLDSEQPLELLHMKKERKEPSLKFDEVIPPPVQKKDEEPPINIDALPEPPAMEPQKKVGFFSKMFGKKKQEPTIEMPVLEDEEKIELPKLDDNEFAPPGSVPELKPDLKEPSPLLEKQEEEPEWEKEGEDFMENEMLEEGEHFIEKEMTEEGETHIKKMTPLLEVKGVGPAREKKLKKAGIKSAEQLATHHHKSLSKKINIPEAHAKEIISNAKKIASIKENLKIAKKKEEKGISGIIKQLEEEKKVIDNLHKNSDVNEEKIIELEGHQDLIEVLQGLEQRRKELVEIEQSLSEKEGKLSQHNETYMRDMESIENLKRRLDHDVRERTQYLINLEKEYFQKAQSLAKQQSDVDIKDKSIFEKEKFLKEQEVSLKRRLNSLEDKNLTIETKDKRYEKLMKDFEKQDVLLREKEDDIMKRESEYMIKLDALETHEKSILKNLEEKRKSLESKEKEIEIREKKLNTTQRVVDKKSVAVEYAKNILEEQKNNLVDDEFEQYLHEQIGMLKTSGISINDINLTKSINVPNVEQRNKTIYQVIDTCKDLIKNAKVDEAKIFYNQLREKYYGMSFPNQNEKESIHNTIRTLYDEINLADIGTNN